MPDVFQIIVKEKGVFTNVTSPSTKAKLRILFEVAPLALLVRWIGLASVPKPESCAAPPRCLCSRAPAYAPPRPQVGGSCPGLSKC